MRSIALVAPRRLDELILPDPPEPGPGEVLVKLKAVGICGSDMHWYQHGGIGLIRAVYPQVLGHEPAGEIVSVGKDVHHRNVGDRVTIEPSITCGHCEFCLRGQHNNCPKTMFMGSPQAYGLFRQYAVVPEHNTDRIPPSLDWHQATLIEPLAVMVHALELISIRLGDTVAVMGAGPIGMLAAAMAKHAGASRVFICDPVPHRLPLARRMGADVALPPDRIEEAAGDDTRGRGVDVVIDASGSPDAINCGLRLARCGGTVLLIGIAEGVFVQLDMFTAMNKELQLQTLKRSNHKGVDAGRLLAAGHIQDTLITHRLPFAETPRGFALLENYADCVGKVVIDIEA